MQNTNILVTKQGKYKNACGFLAKIVTMISIIAMILYPTYLKFILPGIVFLTIAQGDFGKKFRLLQNNRTVLFGIILVLVFAIGMLYSKADFNQITSAFSKYTKILYLIFLIPLFTEVKWRRLATNILICVVFFDIVYYLLLSHHLIHLTIYSGGYIRSTITVSAILAFVAFILANRVLDEKQNRVLNILLCSFAIYSLFFIFSKRTGHLVGFALMALSIIQRLRWRGVIVSLLLIPLLGGVVFYTSPKFQERVTVGFSEAIRYLKTNGTTHDTSIGYRMAFTKYSMKVIKNHMLIGTGTGSFSQEYSKAGGPLLPQESFLRDPHNEYIMITLQVGIIGLLFFLLWLAVQIYESTKLPHEELLLSQGVITTFMVHCFCNGTLVFTMSGVFYILFLGIYFSSRYGIKLPNCVRKNKI